MSKANKNQNKLFMAFGVITIISGAALAVQGQYLIGIPGSIVGAWLVWQNARVLSNK